MEIPQDPRFVDLTGRRYGRLFVVGFHGRKHRRKVWDCLCDCGNYSVTGGGELANGKTISCGCYGREKAIAATSTHSMSKSIEYTSYVEMKRRCYDKEKQNYKNYGGRGITVCDRWLESFENFYEDMGCRKSRKYSLDRINNDAGYTPSNCRWATSQQQSQNQRTPKNNTSGVKGVCWNKNSKKWVAYISIDKKSTTLGFFTDLSSAAEARKQAEKTHYKHINPECPKLGPAMPERY